MLSRPARYLMPRSLANNSLVYVYVLQAVQFAILVLRHPEDVYLSTTSD